MDPLALFDHWCRMAFPNSRFVSLKEVKEGCFIITGSTNARKGLEIAADNKDGLAFWWPVTGRPVRIQGIATTVAVEAVQSGTGLPGWHRRCVHRECRWIVIK